MLLSASPSPASRTRNRRQPPCRTGPTPHKRPRCPG
ncbi:MAG: hypothetical protein LIO81_10865 [Clostridiales bacterium]|nr:hypothetical protein [Clostridiales bacterium]